MSGMNLFELIRLGIHWDSWINVFQQTWEAFDHYSFKYLSTPFFSFWGSHCVCLGTLGDIPPVSEALFICRHLFFLLLLILHNRSWLIFKLTDSSASSRMLLNLYSKLSLLLIVLLNFKFSIWISLFTFSIWWDIIFVPPFSALDMISLNIFIIANLKSLPKKSNIWVESSLYWPLVSPRV